MRLMSSSRCLSVELHAESSQMSKDRSSISDHYEPMHYLPLALTKCLIKLSEISWVKYSSACRCALITVARQGWGFIVRIMRRAVPHPASEMPVC